MEIKESVFLIFNLLHKKKINLLNKHNTRADFFGYKLV